MELVLDNTTRASDLVSHYASDVAGKTILITGPSPGSLGDSFVRQVAAGNPAMFILASRSIAKLDNLVDYLKFSHPEVKVKTLPLNLLSFADVRKAAEDLNSWEDVPHIDILVNNAGIMAVPYALTDDGFESQFQTNHLSHFLFTNLVMDKLLASPSGAPRVTDYNFNEGKHYKRWFAYGQSKTANALMAIGLAQRLGSKGLLAFSLCPGRITTNLASHEADNMAAFVEDLMEAQRIYGKKSMWGFDGIRRKDLDQGVSTHVLAAFNTTVCSPDSNGAFLTDCHIADPYKEEVYPWATSKVEADKLWKLSEELVQQEFSY
ncbi:Short-chain dehydrogenase TIC 32 [Colletotrichum siamense]|uniref:Short-chain dehydrogenase TIC 32 n=1 Tax=Colletotrichum siamense TaxID=690259 RepID=A0A9P5F2A8_COLSI|nr:Short-chain dehydrogenase TIC 32 [Colletotrichum siamense]KAF4866048.1 Short-chain dehydrogenase TIC 32 [Colletotrichum siamense]